jgi:hypothetical protein
MCKWQRVIPRHKGSPRYRIANGWKNEYGSFNLEALKFLMHFREPGSSLYFIFTHTHIFSFLIFFFILTFFLFLSFFFLIFFFFFLKIFLFAPLWTLKLHCTRNNFPLERYLKSSILAPSCDLPWIDDPYSTIGCGQWGNHKKMIFGFKGAYPARFMKSPTWGYTMHG